MFWFRFLGGLAGGRRSLFLGLGLRLWGLWALWGGVLRGLGIGGGFLGGLRDWRIL